MLPASRRGVLSHSMMSSAPVLVSCCVLLLALQGNTEFITCKARPDSGIYKHVSFDETLVGRDLAEHPHRVRCLRVVASLSSQKQSLELVFTFGCRFVELKAVFALNLTLPVQRTSHSMVRLTVAESVIPTSVLMACHSCISAG